MSHIPILGTFDVIILIAAGLFPLAISFRVPRLRLVMGVLSSVLITHGLFHMMGVLRQPLLARVLFQPVSVILLIILAIVLITKRL